MLLTPTRRLRTTPYTYRVLEEGAGGFTVYNHMLLPSYFESVQADRDHLCRAVQVWDVGAERQVAISGPDAERLVQWMTPRDIRGVVSGRCVYLPLADERGLMVNDPIGLKLEDGSWWLSIADSDVLLWARGLARGAGLDVSVEEPDVWPLAVQGPRAEELMARVFGEVVREIRFFRFQALPFEGHELRVARSGWSKQGGFEVYVDNANVGTRLFDKLMQVGQDLDVRAGCPNGIERVESALLSYGNDMDANDTPLEAGLESFCSLDADIEALALPALRAQRERGLSKALRGLVLASPEAPQPFAAFGIGTSPASEVRSQAWSAHHGAQLGIAMLHGDARDAGSLEVRLVDDTVATAAVVALPFELPGSDA